MRIYCEYFAFPRKHRIPSFWFNYIERCDFRSSLTGVEYFHIHNVLKAVHCIVRLLAGSSEHAKDNFFLFHCVKHIYKKTSWTVNTVYCGVNRGNIHDYSHRPFVCTT